MHLCVAQRCGSVFDGAADVDKTAEIWLEGNLDAQSFIPEEYWRGNYDDVKRQLAGAEAYVYEDCDGLHGFVGVKDGYIQGVFVRKEMRSKGIGKALLDFCKGKYTELSLHVYSENKKALEFYIREGFQVGKVQSDGNTEQKEYEMIWRKECE